MAVFYQLSRTTLRRNLSKARDCHHKHIRGRLCKVIAKKRDGETLSRKDIQCFVDATVQLARGDRNDQGSSQKPTEGQIGAMLMAMYHHGLNGEETSILTQCMARSGETFQWPEEWKGTVVDKHSTGGVGDKVSHVLVPALAACGLKVPMISGRSLDITGGTLDKLESIPGFRVQLTKVEMEDCLREVGCFIAGQTLELVPADKILYAAREKTATVNSTPLITASILSKKFVEDLSALVFDVKFGRGALLRTEHEARALAERLVNATNELGIKASAFLTTMDNPLGKKIGNTLETVEALTCLHGSGPSDLLEVVHNLGGELLLLTGKVQSREEGCSKIQEVLQNGSAMEKFRLMVIKQGVSEDVATRLCSPINDPWTILPRAKHITKISYEGTKGHILEVDARSLAKVWKEDMERSGGLNYAIGVELMIQQGDQVEPGDVWVRVHHDSDFLSESQLLLLKRALKVGRRSLIHDVITTNQTVPKQRRMTPLPVFVRKDSTCIDYGVTEVKGTME